MKKSDITNLQNIKDERVQKIISQVQNDGGIILYVYLRGSHCQGLDTETSDEDYGMFYASKVENLLDLGFNYKDQYADDKNDVYCQDIQKVSHLLLKSNPTVLETLFVDDEFVIYEHPIITELKNNRDRFISKECFNTFFGYARSQSIKSTGQNKMATQPIIERKTPLDFCYTFHKQGSTPIKKWLEYRGLKQQYAGCNNIPNADFMHGVFYSFGNHFRFENISLDEFLSWYQPEKVYDVINAFRILGTLKENSADDKEIENAENNIKKAQHQNFVKCILEHYNVKEDDEDAVREFLRNFYNEQIQKVLPYKGICGEDSEELRLSSVEKDEMPLCHMHYNKDKFSTHCKDFSRQKKWISERNPERFRQNMENLKKQSDAKEKAGFYDSKNLASCFRMIQNAIEIARDGKYIVNRRNIDRDFILKIKKGELSYNEIMEIVNKKTEEMNQLQKTSTIPEHIDQEFLNNWLLNVRMKQLNGEL